LLNAVYILNTVSFVITQTMHKASLTLVTVSPEWSQLTYTLTTHHNSTSIVKPMWCTSYLIY
jgi:hypothetical protein